MGVMIGPICGPILGGWLTENYSWRWVFYINVPFGIVTVLGLLKFLKETSHGNAARLDWIGFGALSLGIGALQTMLDRGETLDWFGSREIIVEACLAGLGFYAFLVQFCLAPRPFISPKLFADRNFVVGVVLYFIMGLIMYATLALLAPYLQTLMNYPVVTAGVVLAPRGVGTHARRHDVRAVAGKISPRLLVGIGFVAACLRTLRDDVLDPRCLGMSAGQRRLHPGSQHRLRRHSHQHHRLRDAAVGTTDRGHQHLQPDAQSRQRDRNFRDRRAAADQHSGQPRDHRGRGDPVQSRIAVRRASRFWNLGPRHGAALLEPGR